MKTYPIIFSTAMVKAILQGQKTMTRRLVKRTPLEWLNSFSPEYVADPGNSLCPFGKEGDLLWVRETWAQGKDRMHFAASVCNPKVDKLDTGWKPSIHLKKEHARIYLQNTGYKIERLNDISEDDAIAEGVVKSEFGYKCYLCDTIGHNISNLCTDGFFETASESFMSLFESLNGELESDPWVWAVKFKVISTTGKPE
jgi:hypothetical protein